MTAVAIPLPDPPLSQGAVTLRPWARDDAGALVCAWADPDIARWTGVPERTDRLAAERWIAGDAHRRDHGLALDLVVDIDGVVVGEVGLAAFDPAARTAEIGWWVAAEQRGRGLATLAARLLAEWATDELCVDLVVARCQAANPASSAVARAAGFSPFASADGDDVEEWRFVEAASRGTVPS